MRYVENEGAVFRIKGPSNAFPDEVWHPKKGFVKYEGDVPKPMGWGSDMSPEEAKEFSDPPRSKEDFAAEPENKAQPM